MTMNKTEKFGMKAITITCISLVLIGMGTLMVYAKLDGREISDLQAKQIAYQDAKVTLRDIADESIEYESDDNTYTISFLTMDGKDLYEYEISARTGDILEREHISYDQLV